MEIVKNCKYHFIVILLLSCSETKPERLVIGEAQTAKTEVFVLGIDTFRPDCIEAYGDSSCAQTPNINYNQSPRYSVNFK